jgi:ABC-type polysaccharide/polyol phosphate transport system ATPase subunit
MYVRLAFAVAIHASADILVIDEVLAVGDAQFRARCLERLLSLERTTMVMVSHDLDLLPAIATRGVVFAHGRRVFDGPLHQALDEHRRRLGTPGSPDLIP